MVIPSGSLSWGAVSGAVLLAGVLVFGHATWSIAGGASPDDPGIVTPIRGSSNAARRTRGTPMTLRTQQGFGVVLFGAGAVALGLGLVLPRLLAGEDEDA